MSVDFGMKMEDYLALPAVSASVVKAILDECPRAAWHRSWLNPGRDSETSDAADIGTIAHSILLEGHTGKVAVIDPEDHPAEKTGAVPDGWTNKSIRAARDAARVAGLIPVLTKDMERVNAMVASARAYIESLRASEPAVWALFQPGGGNSEVTVQFEHAGVPCRVRYDCLATDRRLCVDVKTTEKSANPEFWQPDRVGAAFYSMAATAEFGGPLEYCFLVVEQHPPYLCSLVGVDPMGYEIGREKALHGLEIWRQCTERGVWPGYPPRAVYPEIKPWEAAQWEEAKVRGIEYDYATMFGGKAE